MTADVTRLIAYYKSPLGRISRALVREQKSTFTLPVRPREAPFLMPEEFAA